MKQLVVSISLVVAALLTGCGGGEKKTSKIPGMILLDLSKYGLPVYMNVPDTTTSKMEVTVQSWGATEIKVGTDFQVSIAEGEGDIALKKSDIAGDDVNKFKRYVVEEPTIILYESEITQPEFHLYAVVKAGDKSYIIEDIKGDFFSEEAVKKMLEAAKNIQAKETKPNS